MGMITYFTLGVVLPGNCCVCVCVCVCVRVRTCARVFCSEFHFPPSIRGILSVLVVHSLNMHISFNCEHIFVTVINEGSGASMCVVSELREKKTLNGTPIQII